MKEKIKNVLLTKMNWIKKKKQYLRRFYQIEKNQCRIGFLFCKESKCSVVNRFKIKHVRKKPPKYKLVELKEKKTFNQFSVKFCWQFFSPIIKTSHDLKENEHWTKCWIIINFSRRWFVVQQKENTRG